MKIACFSTKPYDELTLLEANNGRHQITFYKPRLELATVSLAKGHDAVCAFVNDVLSREVLTQLRKYNILLLVLRCAGFNNVDLAAADELGITIARVPEYSPHAVAEHTLGLILSLDRQIHRAYNRVRERNFALDGLLGFDLYGRTVGVIGTGKIGSQVCRILLGFGCNVLAYDRYRSKTIEKMGVKYLPLDEVFAQSDIITLHCPLTPKTKHIINALSIAQMKNGVMIINTSRGGLLKTRDVLGGLKSGKIGYLGLDVYEDEADLFFEDRSGVVLQDETFARLLTFPNVLITGHQAFFTREALGNIADVTIQNATEFEESGHVPPLHEVQVSNA